MRITSRILSFLLSANMLWTSVFAATPFDTFSKYLPDIAITDIYQETRFVYMKVCNLGGTLTSSENTLILAIKKLDGQIFSEAAPIAWGAGNCDVFQIASIGDLGIKASGRYNISAGVLLKGGRNEKVVSNNKMTRTIDIAYPSKYIEPTRSPVYSNTNNSFLPYCTAANNYCNNYWGIYTNINTPRRCDEDNNYCNDYYNYNTNYYCNSGNNYCNNYNYNYSNTYCNSTNNYCNNYSYSQNYNQNYNSYCNSNNNYCNNYNYNYNSSSNYYCNSSNNYCNNYNYNNSNNYCNSANNYCNNYNYYQNYNQNYNNTYCNSSNNYCNNYNQNYNSNPNYNQITNCTAANNYCNNNKYCSSANNWADCNYNQNYYYNNYNNSSYCNSANNYCNNYYYNR